MTTQFLQCRGSSDSESIARARESTTLTRSGWYGHKRRLLLRMLRSSAKIREAEPIQARKRDLGFNSSSNARFAAYLNRTADALQPLLHSLQPETVRNLVQREPNSIVFNSKSQSMDSVFCGHLDVSRASMADSISNGFQADSEENVSE